jgi:hypothetical protein
MCGSQNKQRASTFYGINLLTFIIETERVHCAVRTDSPGKPGRSYVYFLGACAKLRKVSINPVMFASLCVCVCVCACPSVRM